MFEDFDARNQVIAPLERFVEGAYPAVFLDVGADARDGIFGDVDSMRRHTQIPKGLDEKPPRAPGVQNVLRPQRSNDLPGDCGEKLQPMSVTLIGNVAKSLPIVFSIVEASRGIFR